MEGARHVAVDESGGALDRTVYMAFSRQVHHQIGIGLAHRFGSGGGISEIHPQQGVALSRLVLEERGGSL